VVAEGTRFILAGGNDEVDLTFQGSTFRFMLLTATFTVFLTTLSNGPRSRKVALVLLSFALGFFFNALRISASLVLGFYLGAHRVGPALSYGIVPFFFLVAGFIVLLGHAMQIRGKRWKEDPQSLH
jgi:exosortase/archaeosortase family protein